MAPGRKRAGFLVDACLARDLRHQEGRNKVANLTQDFELVRTLEWFRLFFHLLLVEQLRTHSNAFFPVGLLSCGMLLNSDFRF